MKNNPVVMDRILTNHTSFIVDLELNFNITFIIGESGSGRSTVFSIIKEKAVFDKRIRCYNYLDKNLNYKNAIKRSKGKLFVIDNADILLDDAMRQYIAMDPLNQYVIIGRNPTGLMLGQDEIFEMDSLTKDNITEFRLRNSF